jgi:hypothetical protein
MLRHHRTTHEDEAEVFESNEANKCCLLRRCRLLEVAELLGWLEGSTSMQSVTIYDMSRTLGQEPCTLKHRNHGQLLGIGYMSEELPMHVVATRSGHVALSILFKFRSAEHEQS